MIENCAIATMDGSRHDDGGAEYRSGHITVTGDRITAVGEGPAASVPHGAGRIDAAGCLATPGLVNTHHHLYQWLTQGRAQQSVLFDWLTELYPVWARIDAGQVHAAATAGLAWLAMSGCTTSTDHHYIFPRDGLRVVPTLMRSPPRWPRPRGSACAFTVPGVDGPGRSAGGLPRTRSSRTPTRRWRDRGAVRRFHDPSPVPWCGWPRRAPVHGHPRLMRETALARGLGVRMHTHLAETREEVAYCRQALGCTPAEYAEDLGWLGPDVWLAHCVHLDEAAVRRFAATGTSAAHCPTSNARLGAGIAPVRDLLQAGVTVGLGVDGAASSEGTSLAGELRQALLAARVRDGNGPSALTARQALWLGTRGGARCLGRDDETGALRPGLLADIALWRLDTLAHDAIAHGPGGDNSGNPVAALVLGPPAPLELLLVGGTPVVEGGELRTVDAATAAREVGRPGSGWPTRTELAAGHGADDQVRLGAGRDGLGQRGVRLVVRQVLLAGEEPDERAAFPVRWSRMVPRSIGYLASSASSTAHWVTGPATWSSTSPSTRASVRRCAGSATRTTSRPGHGSVCTSTDSTAGRSRTIGAQLSPASADA